MKNVTVFGDHEPNTLAQLEDVASRAARAALMADGHLGYVMPIGGVAAYREQVSVVGVGFDIACGNAAIRTDLTAAGSPDLVGRLGEVADVIQDEHLVRYRPEEPRGRCAGRIIRCSNLPSWEALPGHARTGLRDKARAQLGTVGSGNHYVDVFVGRIGRDLGRRALRQPWTGTHHRLWLPCAVAG